MHIIKTNAMRILDVNKISYEIFSHPYSDEDLTGTSFYKENNISTDNIFKTIVLLTSNSEYIVAMIQIDQEIDLKKLAKIANCKSVSISKLKELTKITGYLRGGCSPLGMKKEFRTFIDIRVLDFKQISFSGGKRGLSLIADKNDIIDLLGITVADFIKGD